MSYTGKALSDHTAAESLAPSARQRTEKGMELHNSSKEALLNKTERAWSELEIVINSLRTTQLPTDIILLREMERRLNNLLNSYRKTYSELLAFLHRSASSYCEPDFSEIVSNNDSREKQVHTVMEKIDKQMNALLESRSKKSVTSKNSQSVADRSSKRSTSSMLARKQAKVDAARARATFAQQEAALRKQQAILDAEAQRKRAEISADLDLLKIESDVAVAEAEVQALKSVDGKSQPADCNSVLRLPVESPVVRTQQYVTQLPQTQNVTTTDNKLFTEDQYVQHDNLSSVGAHIKLPTQQTDAPPTGQFKPSPYAETFVPNIQQTTSEHANYGDTTTAVASEITRFLLKKELLLSRLTHFTDRPETYAIWKSSFLGIMQDLQVSAVEEFDLLVKWLGPDSSKHALSLRASNVGNPVKGLERLWQRLDERFGSPELVEAALKLKLDTFPKLTNKDHRKLFDLSDVLSEIESIKENEQYGYLFAYFDSSTGVKPIVDKLPYSLQEKWITQALAYKRRYNVPFPPFSFFSEFIRECSRARNDPSFFRENVETTSKPPARKKGEYISARKTELDVAEVQPNTKRKCPLHQTGHALNQCKGFRNKPIQERKDLLQTYGYCYKCCSSDKHLAKDCKVNVKCQLCSSTTHPSALHIQRNTNSKTFSSSSPETYGGEKKPTHSQIIDSSCTEVCGPGFSGKSCAKTILVTVYSKENPNNAVRCYAVIDDQSNASLAKPDLFDKLGIDTEQVMYSLSSCGGIVQAFGRKASGVVVESLDKTTQLTLPTLIECEHIPNRRDEIPTPRVTEHYHHLSDVQIPPLDNNADILLLIGRDLLTAHHVIEQRIGPDNSPFAQKLSLGWVIVGQACLGFHRSECVNVSKTYIHSNGRPSLVAPCSNVLNLKDTGPPCTRMTKHMELGHSVFERSDEDEKPGLSVEDKLFLDIMDKEMYKGPDGNWIAPLPFRQNRQRLPNNRPQALKRAFILDRSLQKNKEKRTHFVDFTKRVLDNGHAEVAPPLKHDEECWYLPLFGVYHPHKKDQIRGVFDASAQYEGISLNNVLLTGPNITNNLLGILLRFRMEKVAVTADIEQMFYAFQVREDHRNYLRFLWYENNDPDKKLIEYRMRVHAFGNSSSPAVAIYGMQKTAYEGEELFGSDTVDFVVNDFYVDDGVKSVPTPEGAIDLVKRTMDSLKSGGNLRLHKIASSSVEVMKAFPTSDLGKDLRELDLGSDTLPMQRSLGLYWDLVSDTFTFRVSSLDKPYTRRGLLSVVNSIFDPIGFTAPVSIQGKLILRDLMRHNKDWDEILPPECEQQWQEWKDSLKALESVHVSRPYSLLPSTGVDSREVHVFCDASDRAIAAVAYCRSGDECEQHWSFLLGKAKVAPLHAQTVPRLELCSAVLAIDISETISEHLGVPPDTIIYHTDSKVVLGYICNQSRRFCVYVSNRVGRIRRFSEPEQWNFVPTKNNPADQATRPMKTTELAASSWLQGPKDFKDHQRQPTTQSSSLGEDEVISLSTEATTATHLGSSRFERFSSWTRLTRAIANLKLLCRRSKDLGSASTNLDPKTIKLKQEAEVLILKTVQAEAFTKELDAIAQGKSLPRNSCILSLNPVLGTDGLLRVGGRLDRSDMTDHEKHPIILPKRHHVSSLLVCHYHEEVCHQGRHFTEGAVRSAGFWIIGGKRLVSSYLHNCVKCRKMRGKQLTQIMADLPPDRLQPAPPFSYVGVDALGPWQVTARRTRGGQANAKRWAIMFTCLCSRAVHLEVIEEMSSSSFINALRRFLAIRGRVVLFRSDRGTNFVGATDDLKIDSINVETGETKDFLYNSGVSWIFNPPHSSHMGGVWKRMIGLTRRILNSMLMDQSQKHLTHEVLTTFMAEVAAISNARPLVSVSTDPESPEILSPSTLLTQKAGCETEPLDNVDIGDFYRVHWKRVQALANTFWKRWRSEYLNTLQRRQKWQVDTPNLSCGDVVLLRDKATHRYEWPIALVTRTFPGADSKIRKAEVRVSRKGETTLYTRPISEMILLVSSK